MRRGKRQACLGSVAPSSQCTQLTAMGFCPPRFTTDRLQAAATACVATHCKAGDASHAGHWDHGILGDVRNGVAAHHCLVAGLHSLRGGAGRGKAGKSQQLVVPSLPGSGDTGTQGGASTARAPAAQQLTRSDGRPSSSRRLAAASARAAPGTATFSARRGRSACRRASSCEPASAKAASRLSMTAGRGAVSLASMEAAGAATGTACAAACAFLPAVGATERNKCYFQRNEGAAL